MNSIFKDWQHIKRDYDKSFQEFEDHVNRNMVKSAKRQQQIQLESDEVRRKVLNKFKRLGL